MGIWLLSVVYDVFDEFMVYDSRVMHMIIRVYDGIMIMIMLEYLGGVYDDLEANPNTPLMRF